VEGSQLGRAKSDAAPAAQADSELDVFYASTETQFQFDEELQTRSVVFCTDVSGLVDYVLARRRMDVGSFLLKIGIDGGRGFFKICMTIVRTAGQPDSDRRGARGCDGGSRFVEGGVKRLLILAVVERVP
jgi:hypothetical protein